MLLSVSYFVLKDINEFTDPHLHSSLKPEHLTQTNPEPKHVALFILTCRLQVEIYSSTVHFTELVPDYRLSREADHRL